MYYENVKLTLLSKHQTKENIYDYGFRFTKSNHYSEIFTNDFAVYAKWRDLFEGTCICSTFHEAFDVKKMIGKGSFAKVYLATKRSDGKDYAVKAFSKEFLLSQTKGPVNF